MLVQSEGNQWREYGFLAAQRRRNGIFIVVAGLTGPATYATSRLIETITSELPYVSIGEHPPVLWAVVEADVERRESRRGDEREVIGHRLIRTEIWQPDTRQVYD